MSESSQDIFSGRLQILDRLCVDLWVTLESRRRENANALSSGMDQNETDFGCACCWSVGLETFPRITVLGCGPAIESKRGLYSLYSRDCAEAGFDSNQM
jgi:hypothetical protein